MKSKCYATAPDKTSLEKMINERYYSTNYFINDDMKVENRKTGKILDGYFIKVTKTHWQLRKIVEV